MSGGQEMVGCWHWALGKAMSGYSSLRVWSQSSLDHSPTARAASGVWSGVSVNRWDSSNISEVTSFITDVNSSTYLLVLKFRKKFRGITSNPSFCQAIYISFKNQQASASSVLTAGDDQTGTGKI